MAIKDRCPICGQLPCVCVPQDLEYCSVCGQPTIHNAFSAPVCEECTENPKQALVVNFIGGPGVSKSSLRGIVFGKLKFRGVDCEEAPEYAKDLTWEGNLFTLGNQHHVFGEQYHRIYRSLHKVEVVVTDSPLLLTAIYGTSKSLSTLALEEFNKMWNYVVFLKRCKPYNPNGRNQTEEEAREIDRKILDYLMENEIPFETFDGVEEIADVIVQKVLTLIGKQK